MKRQVPGLADVSRDSRPQIPDGIFLVSVGEQIDEKALLGLRGVVKISHVMVNGISLTNLDGFAPISQWEELSAGVVSRVSGSNSGGAIA